MFVAPWRMYACDRHLRAFASPEYPMAASAFLSQVRTVRVVTLCRAAISSRVIPKWWYWMKTSRSFAGRHAGIPRRSGATRAPRRSECGQVHHRGDRHHRSQRSSCWRPRSMNGVSARARWPCASNRPRCSCRSSLGQAGGLREQQRRRRLGPAVRRRRSGRLLA